MTKNRNPEVRRTLAALPFLLTIPLGFLWPRIAREHGAWIERVFSQRLYPAVKAAILFVTGRLPFSLAELILYALCALVPALLALFIVRCVRRRSALPLLSGLLALAIAFGVGLNLFYFTWGFHYFREPLEKRMGLSVRARDTDELIRLCGVLRCEAKRLRILLPEDENGVSAFIQPRTKTLAALPDAYAGLAADDSLFTGRVSAVKPVLWSTGLSRLGIAGIYIGLTAEGNVNVDQPALSIPHAAAHETAHQLGIASENEAEFVAFLACMRSGDLFVRYSSVVQMLIAAGNALCRVAPDRYYEIAATYSEGLKRDLAAHAAYWDAYEGPVSERASEVNDSYLKHNEQPAGVQSYGEVVDLLLAYAESKNIFS